MSDIIADKVLQYSSTVGAGTFDLGLVAGNNRTWRSKFATGSMVLYVARRTDGTIWEIGRGVLTHGTVDTLTRVEIFDSSDGGTAINWVAADGPYVLFSPQSNMVVGGLLTDNLGDLAPTWLPAFGTWTDKSAGIAVRVVSKIRKTVADATTDVIKGAFEVVPNIWQASQRRYWIDNGAANLTMVATHEGRLYKFDTSAAVRLYNLLAGATTGIGHGFTVRLYPYGANAMGVVPVGGEAVDGGTNGATFYIPPGRITEIRWDAISSQWRTDLAGSPLTAPNGRLTLETGVPVSTVDQTAKTVIYYTPNGGAGYLPLRTGAGFGMFPNAELSNDSTATAVNNAGPAALGPYQIVDLFAWLDAGIPRLTRSVKWSASAVVTMTLATPGVVTWASHGLHDGSTVRFTTTGALYTGLTANTDYFATVVDANSFKLSTTLANQCAGTFIATSGSQSGTHTAFNYTSARGTGAGTAELDTVNGIRVNKIAITNGPAAGMGTYLGSVYGNGSSQMELRFGAIGASGAAAVIGLWNAYNRVAVEGIVAEPGTWAYNTSTWRATNGSPTERVSVICGIQAEPIEATAFHTIYNGAGAGQMAIGPSFNSTLTQTGSMATGQTSSGVGLGQAQGHGTGLPFGHGYMQCLEFCSFNTGSNAIYGGAAIPPMGGMSYRWRY